MSMQEQANSKDYLVDLIWDNRLEEAATLGILESEEHDVIRKIGDTSLMSYLLKFSEYLEDHDVFAFSGWEEAEIVKPPRIEKFWTTFYLKVKADCDLGGIKRITNEKEAQNRVRVEEGPEGFKFLEIQILKRYLDAIETRNAQKSDELSDEELGRV